MIRTVTNGISSLLSSFIPQNELRIRNRTHVLAVGVLAAVANFNPYLAGQLGVTYALSAYLWNRSAAPIAHPDNHREAPQADREIHRPLPEDPIIQDGTPIQLEYAFNSGPHQFDARSFVKSILNTTDIRHPLEGRRINRDEIGSISMILGIKEADFLRIWEEAQREMIDIFSPGIDLEVNRELGAGPTEAAILAATERGEETKRAFAATLRRDKLVALIREGSNPRAAAEFLE